jgi:TPP-dependent trihydroxycyclohexane-1,2-dione (THcHDO) dehydratase
VAYDRTARPYQILSPTKRKLEVMSKPSKILATIGMEVSAHTG